MRPYIEVLSGIADCYVSCYPNAGLPNAFGEYDETPHETGDFLREFADSGLSISSAVVAAPRRSTSSDR